MKNKNDVELASSRAEGREPALPSGKKYRCVNAFCPNRYSDVVGGDHAFGKGRKNATCIPCLYAEQMVEHGQTIEQVEGVPHLMEMFAGVLEKTGWTWQDMKDSYQRMRAARAPTQLPSSGQDDARRTQKERF